MRHALVLAPLASLLLLLGCATDTAPQQVALASAATQKPVPPEEDILCVREAPTGSKFPVTRCYHRSAWEQAQQDAKEAMGGMSRNRPPAKGN